MVDFHRGSCLHKHAKLFPRIKLYSSLTVIKKIKFSHSLRWLAYFLSLPSRPRVFHWQVDAVHNSHKDCSSDCSSHSLPSLCYDLWLTSVVASTTLWTVKLACRRRISLSNLLPRLQHILSPSLGYEDERSSCGYIRTGVKENSFRVLYKE